MRLKTAHVRNYRSVRDTGVFDIEYAKTILVGPNEAGKTAILQALQRIRPPKGVNGFDVLRDYPRALYNDITAGRVKPEDVPVATVTFELDDADRVLLPESMGCVGYSFTRNLDNSSTQALIGGPALPTVADIRKDLIRLSAHIDGRAAVGEGQPASTVQADKVAAMLSGLRDTDGLTPERTAPLRQWLTTAVALVDENDAAQDERLDRLNAVLAVGVDRQEALSVRLRTFRVIRIG